MKTRTLHVIDGGKGGTGKSTAAMIVCDYLATNGQISKTFVLDGDLTNPDIFRRFETSGATVAIGDLRRSEDWLQALEAIESANCNDVVVSLPATADASEIAPVIKEIVDALGYRLITYFVIVKNPDCIELLSNSFETGIISISQTYCVILNEISGKLAEFRGFLSSEIKQKVEADWTCPALVERH
jgi:septum formation inhibitor-activating ATPase MinD